MLTTWRWLVGASSLLSVGSRRRAAADTKRRAVGCGRQIVVDHPSPIRNNTNTSVFVMLLSSSACGLAAILGLAESAAAAAAAAGVMVEVPSVQRVHDVLLTNSR